jgi:PhnB protein
MHSPQGQNFWSKGTFQELVRNEKLVMTDSFSDEQGNILPASAYGMSGNWPLELLLSVTFDDYEGKTRVVIRHVGTPEGEMTDLTEIGWKESIDKLSVLIEEENKKPFVRDTLSTMLDINPYLNFPGTSEEAFTFYKSVFGGEFIMIMRYRETPDGEKFPPEVQDKIMHIALPLGKSGNILMATDVIEPMGQKLQPGNNFYISISAGSKDDADRIFNRLSEGGAVEMAMNTTFWGSYFGMFRDKFGVQWMISSSNNN